MGGQIVLHSFRLVFRNLSDALKISVGPYAIGLILVALVFGAVGVSPSTLLGGGAEVLTMPGDMSSVGAEAGKAFAGLISALILLFISSWVAVAWHRFVLLEEYPGFLPALSGRAIWSYIGRAIKLALLLLLFAIPLSLIAGLVLMPVVDGPQSVLFLASLIVAVVLGTILTTLSIRFGLILPAGALDRPMTLRESWTATAPVSMAIMTAVLILVVLNVAASAVLGLLLGGTVLYGIANDLLVNWVSLMVGLSILTTIYGHVIEGRPID